MKDPYHFSMDKGLQVLKLPARVIVDGPQLTGQQAGEVAHHYNQFCLGKTAALGEYFVRNGCLSDGSPIRIVSFMGEDRIYVKTQGGGEPPFDMLPLCVFTDYNHVHDPETVEPGYPYLDKAVSALTSLPINVQKFLDGGEAFKFKGGVRKLHDEAALNDSFPGNADWSDRRPIKTAQDMGDPIEYAQHRGLVLTWWHEDKGSATLLDALNRVRYAPRMQHVWCNGVAVATVTLTAPETRRIAAACLTKVEIEGKEETVLRVVVCRQPAWNNLPITMVCYQAAFSSTQYVEYSTKPIELTEDHILWTLPEVRFINSKCNSSGTKLLCQLEDYRFGYEFDASRLTEFDLATGLIAADNLFSAALGYEEPITNATSFGAPTKDFTLSGPAFTLSVEGGETFITGALPCTAEAAFSGGSTYSEARIEKRVLLFDYEADEAVAVYARRDLDYQDSFSSNSSYTLERGGDLAIEMYETSDLTGLATWGTTFKIVHTKYGEVFSRTDSASETTSGTFSRTRIASISSENKVTASDVYSDVGTKSRSGSRGQGFTYSVAGDLRVGCFDVFLSYDVDTSYSYAHNIGYNHSVLNMEWIDPTHIGDPVELIFQDIGTQIANTYARIGRHSVTGGRLPTGWTSLWPSSYELATLSAAPSVPGADQTNTTYTRSISETRSTSGAVQLMRFYKEGKFSDVVIPRTGTVSGGYSTTDPFDLEQITFANFKIYNTGFVDPEPRRNPQWLSMVSPEVAYPLALPENYTDTDGDGVGDIDTGVRKRYMYPESYVFQFTCPAADGFPAYQHPYFPHHVRTYALTALIRSPLLMSTLPSYTKQNLFNSQGPDLQNRFRGYTSSFDNQAVYRGVFEPMSDLTSITPHTLKADITVVPATEADEPVVMELPKNEEQLAPLNMLLLGPVKGERLRYTDIPKYYVKGRKP